MAACASCGKTILFGGKRAGDLRFCNAACEQDGQALLAARALPQETVTRSALEVHRGLCPGCGGSGPIDVHVSHRVWSAVVLTSWVSIHHLCCRSCGLRHQLGDLVFSLLLGWWGVPFGLLVTPLQVARNLGGMLRPPDAERPSARLLETVRSALGAEAHAAAKPGALR